jgi:hypothetical protein
MYPVRAIRGRTNEKRLRMVHAQAFCFAWFERALRRG